MADDALLELRSGALDLGLCPRQGGTIAHLRWRGRDLLRPAGAALIEQGDVRESGCFPMVPFSGRIADARFGFRGETFELERNFGADPHAIHGQGWQLPWQVAHAGENRAELVLEHHVAGTPLFYHATQTFALSETALEVKITLTNAGDRPMPAGMGLHPYFIRTPGATLQATLGHVWLTDQRMIPRERVDLPETFDFSRPRRLAGLELDHGFGGWDGRAELIWPEQALRLRLQADPVFDHLVIYVPPGEDFFCVEPTSHANNGFNLLEQGVEETGVQVLEAGESLSGTVSFLAG